jgi:hypothetical protein
VFDDLEELLALGLVAGPGLGDLGVRMGHGGDDRIGAGSCRGQVRESVAERRGQKAFDRRYRACAPICLVPLATASSASGHRSTEPSW